MHALHICVATENEANRIADKIPYRGREGRNLIGFSAPFPYRMRWSLTKRQLTDILLYLSISN